MSVMNRKMFNRNARDRLSSMGGIATLNNGGLVRLSNGGGIGFNTRNPQMYVPGEMSALQKIALKAYTKGAGSLTSDEAAKLQRNILVNTGQKLPSVARNILGDSVAGDIAVGGEKFLGALRDIGLTGLGQLQGKVGSLFTGKPGSGGLAGQLGKMSPSIETMKDLGFILGTGPETISDEQKRNQVVFTKPSATEITGKGIVGGPNYQDPTLVDPTDPNVITRIQQGIDAQNLANQGKAVSVDPITGAVTETEIKEESPILKNIDVNKRDLSPGRLKAQFGTPIPKPLVGIQEGADGVDADAEFARAPGSPKPVTTESEVIEKEQEGADGVDADTEFATGTEIASQARKSNQADGIIKQESDSAEIKTAMEKGTGSPEDLKAEFLKLLPKYDEDPSVQGLEIAQMFFNIAAGDSPDALTNIADGLRKSMPAFIKRKDRRKAFERETELLAAKYVIQRREADRNRGFQKTDYYVTKDFTGPDGQKYTKGQPLRLNDQAFSFLEKQGLTGNLVNGTIYAKMIDNANKINLEKIKNSGKTLDDLYQSSSKTVKIGQNIEIEVFYPTVTGGASGLKARPAGGLPAWKSVTRGYINDVNAIGAASNSLDTAIKLVKEKGALGTPGLLGKITDATKAVVPESIGSRFMDYNKLSGSGELDNLQRVMALQMARIILNEGGKMISNQERLQVAKALGYTDAVYEGTGTGATLILGSYSNIFTSRAKAEKQLNLVKNILTERAKKTHSEYREAADLFDYKLTGVDDKPKKGEKPKTITGKNLILRDGKYYYE